MKKRPMNAHTDGVARTPPYSVRGSNLGLRSKLGVVVIHGSIYSRRRNKFELVISGE